MIEQGSSPLARGLRGCKGLRSRGWGIIPARAGFTSRGVPTHLLTRDHPRSRGVYPPHDATPRALLGSSPLARGLRATRSVLPGRIRIIPARAGFTGSRPWRGRGSGDHPRSRGVYHNNVMCNTHPLGSSPLARGLHEDNPLCTQPYRIIPARAGFTLPAHAGFLLTRDHPRSRGVYKSKRWGSPTNLGSSPLARGLHDDAAVPIDRARIIPARAGFTANCGGTRPAASGSSPLARGLHPLRPRPPPVRRIIPARAGFTIYLSSITKITQDHPRSRGVYETMGFSH